MSSKVVLMFGILKVCELDHATNYEDVARTDVPMYPSTSVKGLQDYKETVSIFKYTPITAEHCTHRRPSLLTP